MPKVIATQEVDDAARWLASPQKRNEVVSKVGTNITYYVLPGDSHKVAMSMDVDDMDALAELRNSELLAQAMKDDGVRPDTVVIYIEG